MTTPVAMNAHGVMNRQQQLALRLASVPMVVGLACLAAWLVFEARPLVFLGYGCLVLGVVIAMFVPFVLLRGFSETPNVRTTVMISVLAIMNLPVTFFCALQGVSRATRYRVTLQNQAETPWLQVQLTCPGVVGPVRTVAPNSVEKRDLWFQGDGALHVHFVQDDQPTLIVVDDYGTKNLGGAATVVRDRGGQVRVEAN